MKLEIKITLHGKTINIINTNFPNVENTEEFEVYAPQKCRAVEDVLNSVYEQKISLKDLKSGAVVVFYTVEEKYFISYKVKMGMAALEAEEC